VGISPIHGTLFGMMPSNMSQYSICTCSLCLGGSDPAILVRWVFGDHFTGKIKLALFSPLPQRSTHAFPSQVAARLDPPFLTRLPNEGETRQANQDISWPQHPPAPLAPLNPGGFCRQKKKKRPGLRPVKTHAYRSDFSESTSSVHSQIRPVYRLHLLRIHVRVCAANTYQYNQCIYILE
jgi:hypothetical protein